MYRGVFFFLVVIEDEYVSLEEVELVWGGMRFDDINFIDLFLLEDFFEDCFLLMVKINFGCWSFF